MKDFIKWLGVNEKVAKVAVWFLIFAIFLVTTNAMLESIGFPNYRLNYENFKSIDTNVLFEYLVAFAVSFLNFYAITLLVFRIKESKNMVKYAALYLIINIILSLFMPYWAMQVIILLFFLIFCYLYSGKDWKYIIYGLIAYLINIAVQGIWYYLKGRFIDYSSLSDVAKTLLSFDYFIIILVIILVKEVYLKERVGKK